jgi:aminopeptidase C
MTPYQFLVLDEMEQAEAVWSGTHIGERSDEVHNVLLYQIDGFYVEAFYHREHNELVRFRSFSSIE